MRGTVQPVGDRRGGVSDASAFNDEIRFNYNFPFNEPATKFSFWMITQPCPLAVVWGQPTHGSGFHLYINEMNRKGTLGLDCNLWNKHLFTASNNNLVDFRPDIGSFLHFVVQARSISYMSTPS